MLKFCILSTKAGYVHSKMLPKRQQLVFQEFWKSVNVAVTATKTKNHSKTPRKCCRNGNIYGPGSHRVNQLLLLGLSDFLFCLHCSFTKISPKFIKIIHCCDGFCVLRLVGGLITFWFLVSRSSTLKVISSNQGIQNQSRILDEELRDKIVSLHSCIISGIAMSLVNGNSADGNSFFKLLDESNDTKLLF